MAWSGMVAYMHVIISHSQTCGSKWEFEAGLVYKASFSIAGILIVYNEQSPLPVTLDNKRETKPLRSWL